ncbi:helix-turn-helix domain-containing protein [Streptomyces sp. NPDC001502]|uniref:helix-turn-helix domain-containing protein n=1 Tax=Streptomyces sp. NPDC001502 TaxID=3364578 RepID=UPI0036953832
MDVGSRNAHQRRERDRTLAVLHALMELGSGPHSFRSIANRTGLDDSDVHRRLRQLFQAQLCHRPHYGHWELRPAPASPTGAPAGLVHPSTTPLLGAALLLEGIHRRTQQVVLLHTYSPVSGERLCISAVGTSGPRFRRELALVPEAVDQLCRAPLDSDAPGLAMLANLAGQDVPLRDDLRRIRSAQVAVTDSPLPGWDLVSTPVRRLPGAPAVPGAEPRVVAAVSILAPHRTRGDALVAYGRLLRNAVLAAVETSVVIARPRFAATKAA